MQIKDIQISIEKLGKLVFWHAEIFDLIRHHSGAETVPDTNQKFYEYIGFKPTFYS